MRGVMALMVAGVMVSAVSAWAYDDGDWQLWSTFDAGGKTQGGFEPRISQDLRLGDTMSEYFYSETYLSLGYQLTDWFKPVVGLAQIYERSNVARYQKSADEFAEASDHIWKQEQDPRVDLYFTQKLAGWGLEDRVRMEYRDKDDDPSYMRYRNRIRVKSPWEISPVIINPYVAWETNYEDDSHKDSSDRWNRHRVYAGVTAKLSNPFKAGLYYMYEMNKKAGEWTDLNVLGIDVGASF
jgi:hypothetical protein